MKKECDFCGAENEDWMKICINCGNELKDKKEEVKEAKVEKAKAPTTIRTTNPNNVLILTVIILSVVLVILLFAVMSKYGL